MKSDSLSQIDHALQQARIWMRELSMMLDWADEGQAYRALRVALPLVRSHLPVGEAADLAAQLPLLMRALYFEGWQPSKEPVKDRNGAEFIDRIARAFSNTPNTGPAEIASAVFALLSRHVSPGEIAQVQKALPEGVRRYWPVEQKPAGEAGFAARLN